MNPVNAIGTVALFSLAAFIGLATASDLRKKIISNKLNYSFLALAFALAFLKNSLTPLFLIFVAAAFCFGYVLYALGAWAGGDAKFFTTLAAFYAVFNPPMEPLDFAAIPFAFLLSAAFFAPLALTLFWKRFHAIHFKKAFLKSLKTSAFTTLALAALFTAYGIFTKTLEGNGLVRTLAFSFACLFATTFFVKTISLARKALVKRIPASALEEGMVPAKTLCIEGKKVVEWKMPSLKEVLVGKPLLPQKEKIVANAFRARGLTEKEIRVLKRGGVKYLLVRETLSYAPSLGAAVFLLVALSVVGAWS